MEFHLTYHGPLHVATRPNVVEEKLEIRRKLHPQLAELWRLHPSLAGKHPISANPNQFHLGPFRFIPIIATAMNLGCEMNILFLRPQGPGAVVGQGGDIDSRLKTLLDALRVPTGLDEIPPNAKPAPDETPFFCLLEDDALISSFKVTADRLLEQHGPSEVVLVMHVSTKARTRTPSTQWLD